MRLKCLGSNQFCIVTISKDHIVGPTFTFACMHVDLPDPVPHHLLEQDDALQLSPGQERTGDRVVE